jgi:hypothetical protein
MLRDTATLTSLRQQWHGVRNWQMTVQAHLNAGDMVFGHVSFKLRDITHNLILLFAFSAFEDVLKALRDQGVFSSKTSGLGDMMHSSRTALPWQSFDLVNNAREIRNRIAHDQQVIKRGDIWCYIDALENELLAWGIVSAPPQFKH